MKRKKQNANNKRANRPKTNEKKFSKAKALFVSPRVVQVDDTVADIALVDSAGETKVKRPTKYLFKDVASGQIIHCSLQPPARKNRAEVIERFSSLEQSRINESNPNE